MKKFLIGVLAVLFLASVSFAAGSPADIEFLDDTLIVTKNTKGFPDVGGWQVYHELFYIPVFTNGVCPTFPVVFEKIDWKDVNIAPKPLFEDSIFQVSYLKKSVQVAEGQPVLVLKAQYVFTELLCVDEACTAVMPGEITVCPVQEPVVPGGFGKQFKPAPPTPKK